MTNAVERYIAGDPVKQIAADLGCSSALVIHYARKAGIGVRRVTKPERKACEHCGAIYTPPKSNRGRKFCSLGCRAVGMGAAIKAAKPPKQEPTVSGYGYRYVFVPQDHVSRTSARRKRKDRAPEHIVVAEGVLGRPLAKGEVVHHINCDKLDNRKENLLICTRAYHAWLHGEMSRRWAQEHLGG